MNACEAVCDDLDSIRRAVRIYKEFGVVVLRNAIEPLLIVNLYNELIDCIENGRIINLIRDVHYLSSGELSSAHNLSDYLPGFSELKNSPNVKSFIDNLYPFPSKCDFNSSFFAKPAYNGLATKPHQDNAFFCMTPSDVATFWMPVDPSTLENGSLYYYLGSDRLGNLVHEPEGNLGASMCISDRILDMELNHCKKIYIETMPGDCIVHNSLIVHGSDSNRSQFSRRAFNFSVANGSCVRDKTAFLDYKERLKKFLSIKK